MSKHVSIKTILFDLDGTLADTAPDLAAALNTVLVNNGREALPFETIRPVVSHGGQALIKLGFQIEPDHAEFELLYSTLLDYYKNNIATHTRLFSGMDKVLKKIEQLDLNWGVVTNKPGWLTEPLMDALNLSHRTACIVSGDTLIERKPHPAPLLHACELAGSQANECIYIGDAERDIVAGERAGMTTLVALFGYIDEHDQPQNWGSDGMIKTPQEILDWLKI